MNAINLYERLDKDFELAQCNDDWSWMDMNDYICDNFQKRYMGLVLDNSETIESVFTAVFPTDEVINQVIINGKNDCLLFTHHPMSWDITSVPVFQNIDPALLSKLQEKRISLYTLHVPLDKNGNFSTTINLARELAIEPEIEFFDYFGVKVGVIGITDLNDIDGLADRLQDAVQHEVKLYQYGVKSIRNNRVALIAGGGALPEVIEELLGFEVNTFLTGITKLTEGFEPSEQAHALLQNNQINLIGGTHYSTEKFACIAMVDYFKQLDLPTSFIEGEAGLEDL